MVSDRDDLECLVLMGTQSSSDAGHCAVLDSGRDVSRFFTVDATLWRLPPLLGFAKTSLVQFRTASQRWTSPLYVSSKTCSNFRLGCDGETLQQRTHYVLGWQELRVSIMIHWNLLSYQHADNRKTLVNTENRPIFRFKIKLKHYNIGNRGLLKNQVLYFFFILCAKF